jgi:plastocyanin
MTCPGRVRSVAVVLASLVLAGSLGACTQAPPAAMQGKATKSSVMTPMADRIPADAPRGAAVSSGGVQRVSVDVSKGFFDPMVVDVRAGEPLEITFGQGQGCMAKVLMSDFGVSQDLTSGGAVVKLPVMKPGEYTFSCGMKMQFGKLVVK